MIDLRQKVQMYEREIKLVTENSTSEIETLTKQLEEYAKREDDFKMNIQIR